MRPSLRSDPRRLAAAGVLALLVGALLLAPAAPAPAQEELGLEVTVGYDGRAGGGAWQPVEVLVDPARAVRGTLTVRASARSGAIAARREVEVSPGSPKRFRFLLPAGVVVAQLVPDRGAPVETRARAAAAAGYLVGILGGLPTDVPPLRAEPVGEAGTWVGVAHEWLELSPAALEPLGTLVVRQDELVALSAPAARNLAAGVALGTDLVVVGAGGVELPGLRVPALDEGAAAGWVLTADDVGAGGERAVALAAPHGRARVVVTTVEPGEGELGRSAALWSQLAQPAPLPAALPAGSGLDALALQLGRLLTDQPAPEAPALPWLTGFTVAYVAVAGPVNAVMLARMRRRELAWVTVPIITLVFTVAAFGAVSAARPPVGVAASVRWWIDGAGGETAVLAARSPQEAAHEAVLAGGDWSVRPLLRGGRVATVRSDGDATRAQFPLAALDLGGVVAERAVTTPAPLAVDAVAAPDGVQVTVSNVGSEPVRGVVVRAATATRRLGELAPGARETVDFSLVTLPTIAPFASPFDRLPTRPPASLESLLRTTVMDGSPGLVWAFGQTPGAGLDARVDGSAPEDKGGLVAVAASPTAASSDALSAFAVRRDLFARADVGRPSPLAVDGPAEAFLRFRLPAGAAPSLLGSQLQRSDRNASEPELSVWEPATRQWVRLAEAFAGGAAPAERLVSPLGEVWVRASGALTPFDYSGRSLTSEEGAR
jgi:hypothetical protein